MRFRVMVLRAVPLCAAVPLLSGCLAVSAVGAVGGAAVAVGGVAVGVTAKAVGATAHGAGAVAGAVIPGGKKDDRSGS